METRLSRRALFARQTPAQSASAIISASCLESVWFKLKHSLHVGCMRRIHLA